MKLRRFLMLAGMVALAVVVAINFGYINKFTALLSDVRWYVFPLVLAVQGFDYFCNAKYYQSIFRLLDYELPLRPLFEVGLAINFVNQVFPSGGVSGASFLSRAFKDEVTTGKATLAQLGRYIFTFLSFLAVLVVGFVFLLLGNSVTHVTVRLVLLFVAIIIGLSIVILAVVEERTKIEALITVIVGWTNSIVRPFVRRRRPLIAQTQLERFFDEFYEGYGFLMDHKGKWLQPLLYCLGGNLAEVATVYVVFLAFEVPINPGVVIVGYTLANIFSVISVFTSGAGIYEATMIAAFAALGVPVALAVSVVVVYRALNFILFLPLGFRYYRKHL